MLEKYKVKFAKLEQSENKFLLTFVRNKLADDTNFINFYFYFDYFIFMIIFIQRLL